VPVQSFFDDSQLERVYIECLILSAFSDMNPNALIRLPWLRRTPADFQETCKRAAVEADAGQFRSLAAYALDDNELHRLYKTASKFKKQTGTAIPGLRCYKLGILSNGTTKLLAPAFVATALRYGIDLTLIEGEFDQAFQEATMSESSIKTAQPDGILIALDHRGLPGLAAGIVEDEDRAVAEALHHMDLICSGLKRDTRAALFVQNIPAPAQTLFGSLDARLRGSQRRRIERFNLGLHDLLTQHSGILFDVDGLTRAVGYENWADAKQWHMAKLPFTQDFCPLYAEHAMRLLGAVTGASRKCLVLDLDNTLWGGVVGDDGVHGLVLGQGDALGEAFITIQQSAKQLKQRGIILAVCSKNDEQNARAPFREHPDMVLREEDITVFQANWRDKASNLEAIARQLNIGTDALVFIDDNPAEREQVRLALPEVAVPELTEDPSDYPLLLLAGGYFEAVTFTDDDRARAGQYQANAERAQLAETARDINDYLASLEMVIRFDPFDATGRSRISQLTNRSNQFNLTTRRYDDAAVAALEQRKDAFTLQVRLADRFGDNGMISVIICLANGTDWTIDTWLMSCRVLNRRVEQAVIDVLAASARQRGITRLIGHYIPTEKNGMVREHYAKLGFQPAGQENVAEVWHFDVAAHMPHCPPMQFILADDIQRE